MENIFKNSNWRLHQIDNYPTGLTVAVDRAFGKAAMRLPSIAANDFAMVFFLIRGSKFINCKMKCRELQTSVVAELEDFQNHQHTEKLSTALSY